MAQILDGKKAEFRNYLEKNGIVNALTKVIVGLYEEPEKPENPLEYIKNLLTGPIDYDVEALKHENEYLKEKIAELEARLAEVQESRTVEETTEVAPVPPTTE